MLIGVLALQGAFREHILVLKKLGIKTAEIRLPEEMNSIDALIIPGGESTAIAKLMKTYGFDRKILELRAKKDLPLFGTCAGAILLAKEIVGKNELSLKLVDMSIERNSYGRQLESFEKELKTEIGTLHGVFIRAPRITKVGKDVIVLGKIDKDIVLLRQENILISTFHAELTGNMKLHQYFLEMVKRSKKEKKR